MGVIYEALEICLIKATFARLIRHFICDAIIFAIYQDKRLKGTNTYTFSVKRFTALNVVCLVLFNVL